MDNPLHWNLIKMNLPGNANYDPKMPWVYHWDEVNKRMAAHFVCYIDGIQGMGNSEHVCHSAARRVASWINYIGQQDALHKQQPPSKVPGAWVGAMCLTKAYGLYVMCTQKKWGKLKQSLQIGLRRR